MEFNPSYSSGLTIAVYVGMLVGALFWGLTADIIGRKFAFNTSLLVCSIFAIVAGSSPNWPVLGTFVCLSAFGGGGNLVLDTAVFLEYLPGKDQWLLTLMAAWWGELWHRRNRSPFVSRAYQLTFDILFPGVGQLVAGLFAWAFLPKYSCASAETCTRSNNMGWRYVWFASGSLVFVMSLLRITVIRLKETPKYLVGEGKDAEVVETLQGIATKYNRPCSLTLESLQACGTIQGGSAKASGKKFNFSFSEIFVHLRGLFSTRRIGMSTALIWFSWTLIGLAYPLYNVFLPSYLQSRGADFGQTSDYIRWRNYAIINVCGIFGPIPAGYMCATRLGRKYTMVIGALITMIFFFAYTQVRSESQNLGFNCAINFCLNIYYGTLYAYTPEVLPSAHRGTGNGIAIGCNRIMGIISAVVAQVADVSCCAVQHVATNANEDFFRRVHQCPSTFAHAFTWSWLVWLRHFPLNRMASVVRRRVLGRRRDMLSFSFEAHREECMSKRKEERKERDTTSFSSRCFVVNVSVSRE